jgi:hypothetical protein
MTILGRYRDEARAGGRSFAGEGSSRLEGKHRRVRRTHIGAVFCVLLVATLVPKVTSQAPPKPLSQDRIVQLLKGDVSPARVAELARERGIDFETTPQTEKELRNAGASDALINTLRRLVPKRDVPRDEPALPVLLIESTPGGTQVYIDDELSGKTSAEGRLRIRLKPGQHRVRLSLERYADHEQEIQVLAGASDGLVVRVTLAPESLHAQPAAPQEQSPQKQAPTQNSSWPDESSARPRLRRSAPTQAPAVQHAFEAINGWVTDDKCRAKGANKQAEACTKKCLALGAKLVIVTDIDQRVLMVENPDALKGHEGEHISVTGTVRVDSIYVESAERL